MKTKNSIMSDDLLGQFILSNEEMISIRGGEDGTVKESGPPINL
jgi:hypothetical protein